MMRVRKHNISGSALVVSLVFIILITILIVGFVNTAGLERKTVQSHYAKMQANFYSAMAANVVAARITEATNTADSWWLSQPGRIAHKGATAADVEFVELTSGEASDVVSDVSVNLNPASLLAGDGLVSQGASVKMPVKWVYVREDGTQEFNPTSRPAYNAANPVVGRYAFWADDLSARVNLNAATSSDDPAAEPLAHPSRLALTALGDFTAGDIAAMRTYRQARLFESVEHAKASQPDTEDDDYSAFRAALDKHKMNLTHYSHSPVRELNVFGNPRIVLTTNATRANGAPFFDILNSSGLDPGVNANIDKAKFNALFKTLYDYLKRTDWPVDPGKSFVDKYGKETTAQIVLNLIDYVRSAEADNVVVEASRGTFNTGAETFNSEGVVSTAAGMMGNARRLLITQMGVWISPTAPFTCKFRTEVYLPPSVGDATTIVDLLEGDREVFSEIAGDEFTAIESETVSANRRIANMGSIEGGPAGPMSSKAKMKPGDFRTIVMPFALTKLKTPAVRPVGPLYLRSTIRIASKPTIGADIVPLLQASGAGGMAKYDLDGTGVTSDKNITAIFTNDPVINKSRHDWGSQGANTFGSSTATSSLASTLGQTPGSVSPQQDTTTANNLTDVGFGFPAFKGTSKNPNGRVESLAELGRVHTGGKGTGIAGVPWRTLRLQPRVSTDTSLPDWLLLDLFAVPQEATGEEEVAPMNAYILQPQDGSAGGLINANAALWPFSQLSMPITRTAPTLAVLQAEGVTFPNASTVADNIAEGTLADGANPGRFYGASTLQSAKLYLMPEQLVEIKGVADDGEASEDRLRAFLPLFASRGSVFSVFSVGQKIIQLPNDTIVVQAESRGETLLERKDGGTQILSTKETGL